MSNWQKINPLDVPIWNTKNEDKTFSLKERDELVGFYKGVEVDIGPNESNLYTFKQENGELIKVWGSSILDTRFKNLEVNEEVKIVYLGTVKSEKSKRNYHNYEVYHRKAEFSKVEGKEIPIIEEKEEINPEDNHL